jgi:hypothetical protein
VGKAIVGLTGLRLAIAVEMFVLRTHEHEAFRAAFG